MNLINEFTLPYMNLINVKELMIIITCTTIPSSLKIWMCEFGSRRYVHLNGQQILHKAAVSNNWDFGYKHCMKREKTCSNMLYTRLSKDVPRTELQQTIQVRMLVCHIISKFHQINQQITLIFHVNSNKRTLHNTPILTIHGEKSKSHRSSVTKIQLLLPHLTRELKS